MSWQVRKLGEFISIKHGWAFKGEHFSDSGRYILLTPGNAHESGGLKLRPGREKFYTGDFPLDFLMKTGDMLVVMTDLIQAAPILGGAIVIDEDDRYLHNQRLGLVELLPFAEMDKGFLYYLLNSPEYRAQVKGTATGATVRHTAPKRICDCTVLMPATKEEQLEISKVLSAFDKLIENNRRRIALLEESARLLYREWFVQLRFPGYETVSAANGVPQGWTERALGEIGQQVKEQADPQQLSPDTAYLSMEHMTPKSLTLGLWESAAKVSSSKLRFEVDDVLFGRIRPYFHKVGIAQVSGVTSTDVIVVRPISEAMLPLVALTMSSDEFVAHAVTTSNGTKMPRADWKVLRDWPVLVPDADILTSFVGKVLPSLQMCRALSAQNRYLQEARDALLPKLMSGEIAV